MSSEPYLTFQKFNDPDLAAAIAEQLHTKGIDSIVENETGLLDSTIIGNNPGTTIHLKIPASEFNRAHAARTCQTLPNGDRVWRRIRTVAVSKTNGHFALHHSSLLI